MIRMVAAGLSGAALLLAVASAGSAAPTASPPAPAADAAKGKATFARCAICHKIDPALTGGIGPNLAGVYGRPAGKLPGYAYSAAMKSSRLKWDEPTLARFLAAPSKVVPGTKMMSPPIAAPQDRANLIAFLKTTSGKK